MVAHLLGNTEDAAAGRLNGPPTEAQTRDQIDRHRGDDPVDLLDAWAVAGPFVAAVVSESGMWPAAIDVVTHEHDVRAAIDRPGARDDESITELAELFCTIDSPRPVRIVLDPPVSGTPDADTTPGGPADDDLLTLRTTPFELVRIRLGRRSKTQVEALDWSDDPAEVLDHLFVFGPSPVDIDE